jgi:phosphoesterase RecJ-like protein
MTSPGEARAVPGVARAVTEAVPEEDWARAAAAVEQAGEVCLACHVRPDGDALGSMLAVALALTARGRRRVIASFGDQPFRIPRILRFLPGLDLLTPPEAYPDRPDVMITFDVASADRLGMLTANAARAAELIVLDHHRTNPGFGTVNLIDPAAAATAVLAAKLIDLIGAEISAPVASGLYAGLVTDTGSFRFSTTPQVHRLAARLIETGLDPDAFARELFDTAPFGYLRVLSAAAGRAVLEPGQAGGLGLVWTTVTRADRAPDQLPYEVAESVIDVVRRTAEAEVAVVFKESDDGSWHVSARSKGQVDVARACIALGGGGHSRAAGFTSSAAVPETLAQLRALLAADIGVAGLDGSVVARSAAAGSAAAGSAAGRSAAAGSVTAGPAARGRPDGGP